ncbi:hypothetical protein CVT26_001080 [Gymnopilus dilepis]|uniref:Peptidase M1 membrane alanine aminopeptidase domain-containing protein n=1 Tax=Gymnopilus dilepis TaxID=231916 RepID=A0A409YLL3_9AGAR|nr:hypothetical protein CVT26_001080 [Gymnopilus dilepis]
MALDAKLSSHPIEVDCPDANHINQIFDALSYSKAASVLRMLSAYVGEENFLKGVSLYLKKKLFANSRTHDLWEGISQATGLDITGLMENWVTKVGFPVITVSETADRKSIRVRQDRFLETGIADGEDNETIWNVPLAILSVQDDGVKVDKSIVLQEREKTIPLDATKPFKLNAGTNGVYRVLYTPERLSQIASEAVKENSVFSLEDRLGLVFDAMALSRAGLTKLSSVLTLVEAWRNEKEYLVWQGIAHNVQTLASVWWEYPEIVERADKFCRVSALALSGTEQAVSDRNEKTLFVPLVHKLGYNYPEGEELNTLLLRKLAITQASASGDEGVVAELKSRFKHYVETGDESQVPAELQPAIFTAVSRYFLAAGLAITSPGHEYGGVTEYEALIHIHDNAKTPHEKVAAIQGLSSTRDPALLTRTFDFISTRAREQDIIYFFRALSSNNKARRRLNEYFQDRYDIGHCTAWQYES